jgi:transglutaminase-like putative cysteine protease
MILDMFERFFRWIVHRIGGLTLIQVSLLALTLTSVAWGLIAVVGQLSAGPLTMVALFGMLVGWLLARTRLQGWRSGLVALGIGLAFLVLTIGRIGKPLLVLLPTFWPLTGQILHCTIWPPLKQILPCTPPDFVPMLAAWKAIIESLVSLTTRIVGWFKGVHSGILVVDPLVTPLLWGLALWLVVTWAAWWVRRRNAVMVGLLPSAALLAYNVYYTNDNAGIIWLVLMAGGSVLLQAANGYLKSERHWVSHRMDRVVIEPVLALSVILLAGGLMLTGGLLPSISVEKITNTFQQIFHGGQDKTLAESLGLQQTPGAAKTGGTGNSALGISTIHAIGAGPHLSQDIVMYVTVEGYTPPPPPDIARVTNAPQPDVRYYWRAQTYDTYTGHIWITGTVRPVAIAANAPYYPTLISLPNNYRQVIQHIERHEHTGGALFVTGDLLSTDQSSSAAWRASGDLIDAQTNADIYSAVSRIQYVTVDQLRATGNTYPDSIRRRYLSLPDKLPQRVRDLALDLTANQINLYDRAMAIETYLRKFPYSLDVPAPPSDRDAADYFLFDLKKGYCDYFATSMVVLTRAAGLPARLVTGYSSGSYDYNARRFVVVAANAHAWVEIYFPTIGWVEFEPTTNLSPIPHPGEVHPVDNLLTGIPTPAPQSTANIFSLNWSEFRRPLEILGLVLAGLVILLLLLPLESWYLYLRPADKAVTAIYNRLYHRGRVWGIPADAARTPHEFATALSTRLERLTKNKRLAPIISTMLYDLDWLTRIYTRLLFSPVPLTRLEHRQAVQTWSRIRRGFSRLQRW